MTVNQLDNQADNHQLSAYLGPEGTFSHLAAHKYTKEHINKQASALENNSTNNTVSFNTAPFKVAPSKIAPSKIIPFSTIDRAVHALEKDEVHEAILPKENSTEGAVNQTLDLLIHANIYITYEFNLPIQHQLLTYAAKLDTIDEVISHPQPLAQCRQWLMNHIPKAKLTETSSTSQAVKHIKEANTSSTNKLAAIGTKLASTLYNVPLLKENIEDSRQNATRFIVLKKAKNLNHKDLTKSSLILSLIDKPGALLNVLKLFYESNINLNKIESRPSRERQFDYFFFIDFNGSEYQINVKECLKKVKAQSQFYKFLGSYNSREA